MVSVVIVDSEPQTRWLARMICEADPRCELLAEVATLEQAWAALDSHAPDVLIVEITAAGHLEPLFDDVRRRVPATRVVASSPHESDERRADRAGADGWLHKPLSRQDFLVAVAPDHPVPVGTPSQTTRPDTQTPPQVSRHPPPVLRAPTANGDVVGSVSGDEPDFVRLEKLLGLDAWQILGIAYTTHPLSASSEADPLSCESWTRA